MAASKSQVSHRSAVTGRYVKEHYAKTHPDTTVKERTPVPPAPTKKK